jgi:hypothetical protein
MISCDCIIDTCKEVIKQLYDESFWYDWEKFERKLAAKYINNAVTRGYARCEKRWKEDDGPNH